MKQLLLKEHYAGYIALSMLLTPGMLWAVPVRETSPTDAVYVTQQQQKRTITGTVRIGDTNEPAIGATVYLQNSTIGAVTDVDGKYSIFQPMARPTMTATAWKD